MPRIASSCSALLITLAAALALPLAPRAGAQGFIYDTRMPGGPRPDSRMIAPMPPASLEPCEVRELSVDASIKDQLAEVQMTQVFFNPTNRELEAQMIFPLPMDGTIQRFTLMVDGKEVPGEIMRRDEARSIYEDIVRRRRDPAILEMVGRDLYRTSVFPVPAGAERRVTLRYTDLLKADGKAIEFEYPFAAQRVARKALPHVSINVHIDSKDPLKTVYSPSHEVKIERSGEHEARVSYSGRNADVASDFRLLYTIERGPVGLSVLSWRPDSKEDGYFLILASPDVKSGSDKPPAKNVIMVMDRSGSMSGPKIEQARGAMKFVLENLNADDLFDIVLFDDQVESYKPELQRISKETRDQARTFIENVRPGGSTNIDEALKTVLGMVQDDKRPTYILFVTDGLPTVGEQDEMKLSAKTKDSNTHHAHLFAFGVGYDLNARLLDRLSGGNSGSTAFVKPDENIEAKVSSFYGKMNVPALTNVKLDLAGIDINRTYPRDLPDLFEGGQLVVAGRYRQSGAANASLTGKVGERDSGTEEHIVLAAPGEGSSNQYIERVWAARRIGYILDDIDMHGQNKELTDELVALSKQYGILTPYTAFLAKDDPMPGAPPRFAPMPGGRTPLGIDEFRSRMPQGGAGRGGRGRTGGGGASANLGTEIRDRATAIQSNEAAGALSLDALKSASGQSAVDQRELKAQLQRGSQAVMPGSNFFGSNSVGAGSQSANGRNVGGPIAGNASATGGAAPADETVRAIGAKTFYRRGGVWIDSTVTDEARKSAKTLIQFSDEYFALLKTLKADEVPYLSFREPAVVKLGDTVYVIAIPPN